MYGCPASKTTVPDFTSALTSGGVLVLPGRKVDTADRALLPSGWSGLLVTRYVVTIMLKCTGTKQRFDDRTKLSSEIII